MLLGEIGSFGLELVDEDEAEKGSRSIENVLAVGKLFSGSLWCTDRFFFTLNEWLKLELSVSISDEVLYISKDGKALLAGSRFFLEYTECFVC